MADARRIAPLPLSLPRRRLASVVMHPARMSAEPDSDGFQEVHNRCRWRRTVVAASSRPVPADLVGKCFNCLSTDHKRADYSLPPR